MDQDVVVKQFLNFDIQYPQFVDLQKDIDKFLHYIDLKEFFFFENLDIKKGLKSTHLNYKDTIKVLIEL